MKVSAEHNERIAKMTFASVYPHYVTKVEKKDRTKEELHEVIKWLTGFDELKIQEFIDEDYVYRKTVENIWNIKKCCNDNSARYVEYPKNINDFKAGDSKHPGPESHKQMANELFDIIENNHVLEFTNTDDYNNKHIYRQIQKFTV